MKAIAWGVLALLFLCSIMLSRATPELRMPAAANIFPEFEGYTLSGNQVLVPRFLRGGLKIFVVSFYSMQRLSVDAWLTVLRERAKSWPNAAYYCLFVENDTGLTKQLISTAYYRLSIAPPEDGDTTILFFGSRNRFLRSIGTDDDSNIMVFVVDEKGLIRKQFTGAPTPAALQALSDAMKP